MVTVFEISKKSLILQHSFFSPFFAFFPRIFDFLTEIDNYLNFSEFWRQNSNETFSLIFNTL